MRQFEVGDIAYLGRSTAFGQLVEVLELSESPNFDVEGPISGRARIRPLDESTESRWLDARSLLHIRSALDSLAQA